MKNRKDLEIQLENIFTNIYETNKIKLKEKLINDLSKRGLPETYAKRIIHLAFPLQAYPDEELSIIANVVSNNNLIDINKYFSSKEISDIQELKFVVNMDRF